MRIRKLPAPSKPGHALFAASPSWSDLAIPDFSIRQNRPAAVQFAAGLCHPCFTCICGRQLPSLRPFRGRLPKPCTLCQDAATGQPGCRQEKAGPGGAGLSLIETFAPYYNPSNKPTGVLSDQVSDCLDGKCAGGLLYDFFRILPSKSGVCKSCN